MVKAVTLIGWVVIALALLVGCGTGHQPPATPSPAPVVSEPATCEATECAIPSAAECDAVIAQVYATQDYTGAARPCLGEEDDPRVALALDYGMTAAQYAAAERAER